MHDYAIAIRVVLSAILDFEGGVHQFERGDAEDGLGGGMAQFPTASRLVSLEVAHYLCRIV